MGRGIREQRGQSNTGLLVVTAVVAVAVAIALLLVPPSDPCAYSELSSPWQLSPIGFFSAGLAVVDRPEGTPRTGLVVAHGHDLSPQPVSYYGLDASTLSPALYGDIPDGFSADYAYHSGATAAHLDRDGYVDVCVTSYADPKQLTSGGGVKIYRGTLDGFDPTPTWVEQGFGASNCGVGDFDADGDLDLVVTSAFEVRTTPPASPPPNTPLALPGGGASRGLGTGPAGEIAGIPPYPNPLDGVVRIYRNDGAGGFTPWQTLSAATGAMDVEVADVDRDGWVDLLLAGPRTQLFRGQRPTAPLPFLAAPDWSSRETHSISMSVDAAVHPDWDDSLLVVASHGCKYPGEPGCPVSKNGFDVYRPGAALAAGKPISSHEYRVPSRGCSATGEEYAAALTVEQLDDDAYPDLLGGMWTTTTSGAIVFGHAVTLYPGKEAAGSKHPLLYSKKSRKDLADGAVGASEIRVADLFDEDRCPLTRKDSFTVPGGTEQAAFTLSRGPVSRIVAVTVGGVAADPAWDLTGAASTFNVPETREWVSVSPPAGGVGSVAVVVEYEYGGTVDVVATSAGPGPQFGASLVWRSRAMCPKSSEQSEE